jgi:fumarate hydratase class II
LEFRREQDTLGAVDVPAEHLWGAQTERARRNFPIGREAMPLDLVHAIALVKRVVAVAHADLGLIQQSERDAIVAAADAITAGQHDAEFPLSPWQSGSGTQTHMNVNEVIANLASRAAGTALGSHSPLHPNDDVNRGQSSNDVVPTAIHVAVARAVYGDLLPALGGLRNTLHGKALAFADVVKIGRTHLMDATPLALGDAISAWVAGLDHSMQALRNTLAHLHELPLGGTAVGTGANAHPQMAERAIFELARLTGIRFAPAPNRFNGLAAHDALVEVSAALAVLATVLLKIANDIRLLASGPRCGIGELRIPANEPGSSIMPGKVNPTQAEALAMVSVHVMGLDAACKYAGGLGSLELHVMKPLLARNVLEMSRLLADACRSFDERCAQGLEPDREAIARHLERSLMLVTALAPTIGYEEAAAVAQLAHRDGLTLREAALRLAVVSPEQFDTLVGAATRR